VPWSDNQYLKQFNEFTHV